MIATGLATHLLSDAGVLAIAGDRIYPQVIPQPDEGTQQQPCVVYQFPTAARQALFCATDRVVFQSVQIDCYARAYLTAHQLADLVRSSLLDFSGAMGSVTVKKVLLDTEFDSLDDEPGLFRVTQIFSVWFVD